MYFGANDSRFSQKVWRDLGFKGVTMLCYAANHDLNERATRAAYYQKLGLKFHAHPAIYLLPSSGYPELTWTAQQRAIRVANFRRLLGSAASGDIVNEPLDCGCIEIANLYGAAAGMPRRVNEWGLLHDPARRDRFLALVSGAPTLYEVIGLQAHVEVGPQDMPPLDLLRENLAAIATLGKEMHCSELSVPSGRLGWTPKLQATWIQRLVALFLEFGITYTGLWDLYDSNAWNKTSGLFDARGKAKPAYYVVKELAAAL